MSFSDMPSVEPAATQRAGTRRRLSWLRVGLALTLVFTMLRLTGTAYANTIVVTTRADDYNIDPATCSLREAIYAANNDTAFGGCGAGSGNDQISFAVGGTFLLTRVGQDEDAGATGDLDIQNSVQIIGSGPANTIIDGNLSDTVIDSFSAAPGTIVGLSNLTIRNGNSTSSMFGSAGGIFVNNNVRFDLTNVTFANNAANDSGGAIYNRGFVTLANSVLSGNQANFFGGAIYNVGTAGSSLIITNTTIANNEADIGGGIFNSTDAGIPVLITGSTIANNRAIDKPGGPTNEFGDGAGIYAVSDGDITLTNTTLSGNQAARDGGGIFLKDDTGTGAGSATLNNVTIANNAANTDNNTSGDGGGAFVASGTFNVRNTLIATNSDAGGTNTYADVSGTFNNQGTNLIGKNNGSNFVAGPLVGTNASPVNPLIGGLANNGGATATHALLSGSPAIDKGNNATCATTDQRSVTRPFDGDNNGVAVCDIGAFELDPPPVVTAISRLEPTPTNATSVRYSVTFSESVSGVDTSDFALATTGITGAGITSVSGSGTTYTVTIATGTGDGTIRLDLADNDSIVDSVGNPLGGTGSGNGSVTTAPLYTIDKTAPTVTLTSAVGNPTNTTPIPVSVTFSESVTGFTAGDITPGNATVANFAGSGASYTFDLVPSGQGTVSATIAAGVATDAAGNTNTASTPLSRSFDTIAPDTTIVSGPPTTSSATTATFDFASSELTSTFSCSLDGGAFTPCSDPVTFTGLADGPHTLQVRAIDAAGNGDPTPASYSWTVDTDAPAVTSITRTSANPTNVTSVGYSVTFSESVSGVDASDFAVTTTGITGANITSVSGTGTTYTVTIATGTGDGTLRLDLADNDSIVDSVGNPLGGAGTGGGTNGEVYTIDKTAPTVTAISRLDPTPTNATSVGYSVTFSESVSGVDASDFAVTTTGITGASITSVSGTGTTYTVTIATGTGDGTLRLDLADNDSIVDSAGNPLGGAGTGGGMNGEVYTIDKTAPTVTAISRLDPTPTNATSVTYRVTISENVSGLATANFTLATTGLTATSISNLIGSGTTYTVTIATGSGNGTLRLDLTSSTGVSDPAGNALANLPYTGETYTIERSAPTATIIPVTPDPRNSGVAGIDVRFSEDVTGFDLSDLNLTRDGVAVALNGATLTGSGTDYTLSGLSSLTAAEGSYELTVRATASGIVDAAGNALAADASDAFVVDTTIPTAAITTIAPDPRNTAVGAIVIEFSEPITGLDLADLSLTRDGGANLLTAAQNLTTSDNQTWTLNNLSGLTAAEGNYRITLVASGSGIKDTAGNALAADASDTFVVDTTPPSIMIDQSAGQNDPTGSAPVRFTVVFSEPVTDFTASDVDLSASTVPGSLTAGIAQVSATSYTVAVSGMTGSGNITASIAANTVVDAAGNSNTASTSTDNTVSFDPVVPVVTGVTRLDTDPTNAASVRYTVTFAKSVTGVNTSDFMLTSNGVTGASITSVSGSGTTRIVTVGTGMGSGTLRLDVIDDDSIVDAAGNPLGGTGAGNGDFTSGESYILDRTAPTVSDLAGSQLENSGSVAYTFDVTYTDNIALDVSTLDSTDLRVTGPNGFDQLAELVSVDVASDGTPRMATYRLLQPGGWDGTDNGTYIVTVEANQVRDTVGNAMPAGNVGTFTININNRIFLPLVSQILAPDLVATLNVTPNRTVFAAGEPVVISATFTNRGNLPSSVAWADLYINPSSVPTGPNQPWNTRCALQPCFGLAWKVPALEPGQSITLTSAADSFDPAYAVWPGWFAAGTTDLYIFVDSWNAGIATGAVAESDESNNLAALHGFTVTGSNPALSSQGIQQVKPRSRP